MQRLARTQLCVAIVLCLATGLSLAAQAPSAERTGKGKPASGGVTNINTATALQLAELPGIGSKMAARIVEYRQKNGGFKKIEELMNVRGVGEKNFLKLKTYITVGQGKAEQAAGTSPK